MQIPERLHTKQDFREAMQALLNPLKSLYSPGGARLHLGDSGTTYRPEVIELEAFSRPLWALVPYWAGGGSDADFERIYRDGLLNGTDPASPEYWGGYVDCDQRFVEMAAIACGILLAPEKVWDPLGEEGQKRLAEWLIPINDYPIPDCNWQFFMILVDVAMKKKGMPYNQKRMEEGLALVDSYYLGGGWYRDGMTGQRDYYNPFALHYYALMYAVFMEDEDPERAAVYRQRATEFAGEFIYWFSEGGESVPIGRSLTYRFAQASFWAACLFAGIEPLPVAVMKGLIARHLQFWTSQPIFDRDDVLTIGYCYPNLRMAEGYNAPGSPYWGMKLFLFLALPDDHAFWSVEAAPLPALDKVKLLRHADMLAHRQGGDATLYTPGVCYTEGHGNWPAKYSKFAYNSRFGFNVALSQYNLYEASPDSMLAFQIEGSEYTYVRLRSDTFTMEDGRVVSRWSPFAGITVETTIVPDDEGHTRHHVVTTNVACTAHDCGFAVAKYWPGFASAADGAASARNESQLCRVTSESGGEPVVLDCAPNTSLVTPTTVIPAVRYTMAPGRYEFTTRVATR